MYQKILVALDHSKLDQSLLQHITQMAKLLRSHLLLVHVADGWVARNFERLQLTESEEMQTDRAYLKNTAAHLRAEGLDVSTHLALGDPPAEILRTAEEEGCDLIAMTTHGHRLLGDIFYGSTIEEVRHKANIPILIVRGKCTRKTGKTRR